jgi:Ca-activated chloride channel family protein
VIHWADPTFLHGLWALLPLAGLLWFLLARRVQKLRRLLDREAVARLAPERSPRRVRAKAALWFLAFALATVALARPQWGVRWQQARRRGLEILVVLDTSNSMRATDLKPDRLQRAKWGLGDLLKRLSGDRIGLVVFAGSSFLECPLTVDYAAFSMMLDDVRPGIVPRGGTDIAQALETALESFEKGGDADRVIVLVTDGEDHAGSVDRAITALKEKKVRVFAVGVGTARGELIPAAGGDGDAFLRDRAGNPVRSSLQEGLLERIAADTGGLYVRSADEDFGLDRVYSKGIANLRRDERESRLVKAYEERFPWFLGATVLLLTLESLLGDRRRGKEGGDR